MKKLYFLLVLIAITSINCDNLHAQQVKGQGGIVTETIKMDPINSIGLGIAANIYIRQGNTQKIEIKGQQNIIDLIKKNARGDSWNIEFKRGHRVRDYKPLDIYVTLKELEKLSIGGSGSIIGENKFTNVDDLRISIGGSGDVKVDVSAKDIKCSIGGSGEVDLQGNANELSVDIGGSGDVKAIGLNVKECKVSSAGSGNVDISVSEQLVVSLVGSGDVRYKGSPKIKSNIIGSGKVKEY